MLPLPLTTLIKQLRAAGFPLDPGREMRLRKVVHERGVEYVGRFGEMKYLLAPFVASRPEEQKNFYAFWDHLVADLEHSWADGDEPITRNSSSASGGWRWLLLPLLALLAYGVYRFMNPPVEQPKGEKYEINIGVPSGMRADSTKGDFRRLTEGDTLRLLNTTLGRLRGADSTGFRWRVEQTFSDSVMLTAESFHLEMARPLVQGEGFRVILIADHLGLAPEHLADTMNFFVACANPPAAPQIVLPEGPVRVNKFYDFRIAEPVEGESYSWDFSGEATARGTALRQSFKREGQYSINVRAVRGGLENTTTCFTRVSVTVPVVASGGELPILASMPLVKDKVRYFAARSSAYKWGKWFLLALLLGPLLWWKHRRELEARREKTDEEIAEAYPIFDQGPYNVPYRSRNDQISVPADFYRIADQLRVREESEVRVFDGAATIEATVGSGGFPTWRERSIHRPADYLVLVPHNDEFNQQDLLLKRLTDFLSAREAAITVYYHEGQFEHFWNKDYPKGWSPDRLYDRYQQFRLLILGNAHGLVDNYASKTPQLRPDKAKWLNGWARRLILTTEPAADWTAQEVLLHRSALLYPITMRGLNEGVRMLNETEEYEAEDFVKWRKLQQRANSEPTARYRGWETVADHEDYLRNDPELMRWLRGLAVSGNPDWNLTIAIGRALDIDVTHDRLLQLSRIPWLAGNRPDHDLRFALLEDLSSPDEAAARAAVIRELELVEDSVQGSFAQTEWQTNLAVQQLHLAPASAPQKASLREMIRAGLFTADQLRDLELAAQRKEQPEESVQTKAGPPPARPGSLDRLLAKDDKDWWNTEPGRRFIGTLAIMSGVLLFMLAQLTPQRELNEGEAVPWWAEGRVVDDAARRLNDDAVLLATQNDERIKQDDNEITIPSVRAFNTIDSLLKAAAKLREGRYSLAGENRRKAFYNQMAYRSNLAFIELGRSGLDGDFRDLIHEFELERDADQIGIPGIWEYHYAHQKGLAYLGLMGALNLNFPLEPVTRVRADQIMAENNNLKVRPSSRSGYYELNGRLKTGEALNVLRAERESLFTVANNLLRYIEGETNGDYFDSLAVSMPVNLRTMIAAVQEVTPAETETDSSEEVPAPPVNTTPPKTEEGPASEPETPEDALAEEARMLLRRYDTYRFNQTVTFEAATPEEQSVYVGRVLRSLNGVVDQMEVAIDERSIFSGKDARVISGDHDSESLLLYGMGKSKVAELGKQSYRFIEIVENTEVLIVNGQDEDFTRLRTFLSTSGGRITELRKPTNEQLTITVNQIASRSPEQTIVIFVAEMAGDGNIILRYDGTDPEFLSVESILTLQEELTDKATHSLQVNIMLLVDEVSDLRKNNPSNLKNLSYGELLALIQKSGKRDASYAATDVNIQANRAWDAIAESISRMVEASGGLDDNGEILDPSNVSAVEYEFVAQPSGSAIEYRVTELAELLAKSYQNIKAGKEGERATQAVIKLVTDPSGEGQPWDVVTFTSRSVGETVSTLQQLQYDIRDAEKAFYLRLAESLNLGKN